MKKLSTLLIGVFMILGAHSVLALSGSANTEMFPNEAGAVAAAVQLINEISNGTNKSLIQHADEACIGSYSGATPTGDLKIESVWVKGASGYEKMYQGTVAYFLNCQATIQQ